ncbi:hypothetical protein V5F32_12110 [Xanthobacter oligotrophicus]|uniref:DUF2567 domain-containing protein n=1 Tax=Xanthobacter oligotrophicus TaxID=2607286 RepID=A0ABW6ZW05_9HYPH
MDNLARLLLRFVLVPLGYLAGVIAGAAVMLVGEWRIGSLFEAPEGSEAAGLGILVAIVVAGTVVMLLLLFMWMVATIGILFSEAFAVRSWMFHAANGVVSALVGAQLVNGGPDAPPVTGDPFYTVAAGLAAGLVYWLVAGSSAGFFKPILRSPAERAARLPPPPAPSRTDVPPPTSLPPRQ